MEAGHHEAAWRLPQSDPGADFDLQHWIRAGPARRGREVRLAVPGRRSGAAGHRGVPPAGTARAADPADRAGGGDQPDRADRHRLDDVQLALQPGAPAGVGRPRQRRPRGLEHRHLGDAATRPPTSVSTTGRGTRDRYERADEFLDVAPSSGTAGRTRRVLGDKAAGRFADPSRIHPIEHRGQALPGRGRAERTASAAGLPAAGAGRVLRRRRAFAAGVRRGDLHRAPDPRARARSSTATSRTGRRRIGRDPDGDRASRDRADHRLHRGRGPAACAAARRPAGAGVRLAAAVDDPRGAGRLAARSTSRCRGS